MGLLNRRCSSIVLFCGWALAAAPPAVSAAPPDAFALSLAGSFETLEALGFSPDGITYQAASDTLTIVAAGGDASPERGIFEVTTGGALLRQAPLPDDPSGLGFAITAVDQGPRAGHFFLPEFNSTDTIRVAELDASFEPIASFQLVGSSRPGDGIAYNPIDDRLAVLDAGACEVFEVTLDGAPVRSFPIPCASGLTFHRDTGTFFAVDFQTLYELSVDGALLRQFDLGAFGIEQAVGVAAGGGRLFIADEIDGPNTGGRIVVLELVGADECAATTTVLCLGERRFQVEVGWRDFANRSGEGRVVDVASDDSGLFWFFDPDNWEMLVKVLDGCAINQHFWVLAASTTNVEYSLTVTDTVTRGERGYGNSLGTSAPAVIDTRAFPCQGAAGSIRFLGSDPPPGSRISVSPNVAIEMRFAIVSEVDLGDHALHVVLGGPDHQAFTDRDCASIHTEPFTLSAGEEKVLEVFFGNGPRSCTPLPFATSVLGASLEACDEGGDCRSFPGVIVERFPVSYILVP